LRDVWTPLALRETEFDVGMLAAAFSPVRRRLAYGKKDCRQQIGTGSRSWLRNCLGLVGGEYHRSPCGAGEGQRQTSNSNGGLRSSWSPGILRISLFFRDGLFKDSYQ